MPPRRANRRTAAPSPAALAARARKAQREGRFQTALELARQLLQRDPSADHHELFREAALGRARQLREAGATRDALAVLRSVFASDSLPPQWLGRVAEEFARCGELVQALALESRLSDPAAGARVLRAVADAALELGEPGRALLPEALRPDFDRVRAAFRHAHAGQDDAAREAIQAIALRSPFLEWKLLVRGLLAYYQGDDARALDNWQRLTPDGLPARLAAPFRWRLDRTFRAALPAAAQADLERHFDRLQGTPLLRQLRDLRAALADRDSLAPAYRLAEALLPALRREAPALVPRLAACFYWAILDGRPDDIARQRRVFGAPPDDPEFNRLRAVAYERAGELAEAHRCWQKYEQDLAGMAARFPGDQLRLARALVWQRMGRNAAATGGRDERELPRMLRDFGARPRPLKPDAEECFKKSLRLAPEQLAVYEELYQYLRSQKKHARAEAVARRLLQRAPEHAPTLESLGDLCLERGKSQEGLALLERALRCNPLDRNLREKVVAARVVCAREATEAGRFDDARGHYEAALAERGGQDDGSILWRWAAAEFKAGAPERAEELLTRARERADSPLVVAFGMLVEAARLKLPKALKDRFDRETAEGLAAPPDPTAAAALGSLAAALTGTGAAYVGQKAHARKVIDYLKRSKGADFTEPQLERVARALVVLGPMSLARAYAQIGRRKFPRSPTFPFLEAATYPESRLYGPPDWKVRPLLQEAERLALALPPEDERRSLLPLILDRLRALEAESPMRLIEQMFGGFDEDDEDERY